jgi:dipeptidase E
LRQLLLISSSAVHGSGYLDYCIAEVNEFFGGAKKILFVPFALHDRDAYTESVRARLSREGLEVVGLHEAGNPQAAVNQAQAIFVGGGNTFRLLNTVYELDLLATLRNRIGEGIPYMGTSAGSNLACPTIMTTNDMPIVQPPSFVALNLVPFQLNPHYQDPDPDSKHRGETREIRLNEFHEMNAAPVVALREGAMVRVDQDRMTLKGITGARIFRQGEEAQEYEPGADLSDLLKS